MDKKLLILKICSEAHSLTEECYIENTSVRGSEDWLDKRKYLLADLSLHMVQAALQKDKADIELIKRYLYSILLISVDFIPDANLKETADKIISKS